VAGWAPSAHAQSKVPDLEQEKLIGWRRDIHEHPELGEQEARTSALVAAHLQSLVLVRAMGFVHN
jgi:metal-dependent amidase/aminoacylase/carboxypeptidase family protein